MFRNWTRETLILIPIDTYRYTQLKLTITICTKRKGEYILHSSIHPTSFLQWRWKVLGLKAFSWIERGLEDASAPGYMTKPQSTIPHYFSFYIHSTTIPYFDNNSRDNRPLDNPPLDNPPLDNPPLDNPPLNNFPLDNNSHDDTSLFVWVGDFLESYCRSGGLP